MRLTGNPGAGSGSMGLRATNMPGREAARLLLTCTDGESGDDETDEYIENDSPAGDSDRAAGSGGPVVWRDAGYADCFPDCRLDERRGDTGFPTNWR